MAFDKDKASFFGAAPVDQAATIADAGDTSGADESEHINASLAVYEQIGLVATS